MTITATELIDYLQQFPGDMPVVLDDESFEGEGDYITLSNAMAEFEDRTGHFEGRPDGTENGEAPEGVDA